MKRRITKIKIKKGICFFGWEIYQNATQNWDAHTLTCKDRPRDEFFRAIKNMVRHVMDICEFPKEEDGKKFLVSGITESYTEDNRFFDDHGAEKTQLQQRTVDYKHPCTFGRTGSRWRSGVLPKRRFIGGFRHTGS